VPDSVKCANQWLLIGYSKDRSLHFCYLSVPLGSAGPFDVRVRDEKTEMRWMDSKSRWPRREIGTFELAWWQRVGLEYFNGPELMTFIHRFD
jgi:hypothetical protein